MGEATNNPWRVAACLAPFLLLMLLQRPLGFDDNLLAAPRPGLRDGQNYSVAIVVAFYAGLGLSIVDTIRWWGERGRARATRLAIILAVVACLALRIAAGRPTPAPVAPVAPIQLGAHQG